MIVQIYYPYYSKCYKMIVIDLIKQQVLDSDPQAIQQISFTPNTQTHTEIHQCFPLLKKQKKLVLDILQKLWERCKFIFVLT